ncbi:hypothetical protein Sru01_33340 [Sphaerisporangium rufum]|uniref:Uncharacterized protein n=1 Tax=Sphaerisporangium rufum TaxID=1381558 RepID=A0A919R729_9ACTN|nr:hypothetical protein [Sphaerisporangium rufum]GII78352.1 hypothetical protein Sru01_33340 [Sphaerisporangium rufum]
MTLPVARTRDEAHLYFDLNPCENCGSVDTTWEHALVDAGGGAAVRYSGRCAGCGARRQYLFALPEHEVTAPGFPVFGGTEPSQLLDAGEWLLVADLTAGNVPTGDDAAARQALDIATAAMEEVVKFVPPGERAVPDSAFWSTRGREVRGTDPGRFDLDRLLVVRDTYRRIAGRYRPGAGR